MICPVYEGSDVYRGAEDAAATGGAISEVSSATKVPVSSKAAATCLTTERAVVTSTVLAAMVSAVSLCFLALQDDSKMLTPQSSRVMFLFITFSLSAVRFSEGQAQAAEGDLGEGIERLVVGETLFLDFVYVFAERIVLRHAYHGHEGDLWDATAMSALFLAAPEIFAEFFNDDCSGLAHVAKGHFIAFESGVEHEALEFRVGLVGLNDALDELTNDGFIVIALHGGLNAGTPFRRTEGIQATIDDGGVKLLFGGEVAKDDGFGYAGGSGDFAGGGAFETFAGEKIDGYLN